MRAPPTRAVERAVRAGSAGVLLVALGALGVACGQSYAPWGDGGCDTFCNRWVAAHCRNPTERSTCINECVIQRDLCPAHQRALLRCANLEGNIVCDGDTGATKIANCGLAQEQVSVCVGCATFCRRFVTTCPAVTDLGECVASCLDPRCQSEHASAAAACSSLTCNDEGFPDGHRESFDSCWNQLSRASSCVQRNGGGRAFGFMPERLPPDTGVPVSVDASGGADTGPPDLGTFPGGGGL